MKKIQMIVRKCATILPALALAAGILTINKACFTFFHQTEIPEEMNAYKR